MAPSTTSTAVAPATTCPPSPAATGKYVPLHRRTPSPTRSESSTTSSSASRTYSISELLQLSHQPEVKLVSVVQKDRLKAVLPEIVMNRKMRKMMEYRAYQERTRSKKAVEHDLEGDSSTSSQEEGRSYSHSHMHRQGLSHERHSDNVKVVDEADWRSWRSTALIPVA